MTNDTKANCLLIPETVIRYEKIKKNPNGNHYRALLQNSNGFEIMHRDAPTQKQAFEQLLVEWQQGVAALCHPPTFLVGATATLVIFPEPEGRYTYGWYRDGSIYDENYASDPFDYQVTKREACCRLAEHEWDGKSLTSPYITHPEDQARFGELRHKDKMRRVLGKLGWTPTEEQWIIDGFGSQCIPLGRYEEMPPMPDKAREMSDLAWDILEILVDHSIDCYRGDFRRGYLASWTLGERLGGDACTINAVDVRMGPQNPEQAALAELINLGMVEEMHPELSERFRIAMRRDNIPSL